MTYDPFVLAIVKECPYLYGQALHIAPKSVSALHPQYNPSDLLMFKAYNPRHAEMDELVCSLEDESALAEVHWWHKLMTERAKLERDMQQVMQSVHDASMEQERIKIRMELANLLAHLEFTQQLHRSQRGHRS